jgi:hypothetical protein
MTDILMPEWVSCLINTVRKHMKQAEKRALLVLCLERRTGICVLLLLDQCAAHNHANLQLLTLPSVKLHAACRFGHHPLLLDQHYVVIAVGHLEIS